MVSAMSSAAITDVLTTPLWMIKTRLQTQRIDKQQPRKYRSTLHTFRIIVKEEGFSALWKGLTPQLLGVTHVAVQFPLYEYIKEFLAERGSKRKENLTILELIGASASSKIVASVIAYPHEVLRSRFQYQRSTDPLRYTGILHALQQIFREEGIKGFYRGLGTNLLRVTPSCAITFTTYEFLLRTMQTYADQ